MCKECEENKTKVCKICGIEKPVNEFHKKGRGYYSSTCKICEWLKNNENKMPQVENWNLKDFKILMDNLLNKKVENINELEPLLNKTLKDICSVITKTLKLHIKLNVIIICKNCEKKFNATPFDVLSGMACCSRRCASENKKGINFQKVIGTSNCLYCEKEFDVYNNVPDQKFCCNSCKSKYYNKNDLNKIEVKCDECGEKILRVISNYNKNNHAFCSKECEVNFRHKQAYQTKRCEICEEEFECSKLSNQRFCSLECQIQWQKRYPKLGTNNKRFTSELINCHWCGIEYYEKQYRIKSGQKNFFCSKECRREWFAKKFSQSIEWKKKSAINATRLLCSGIMSKKTTGIQEKVNDLLNATGIMYETEYNCKYVAMDNAIFVKGQVFFIECMGEYWHCDIRRYDNIRYELQKNRIRLDKIKNTYIKNIYGVEILYLWEKDINENLELCKKLIKQYIDNNGMLENYHSSNYHLKDNKLCVNEEIAQQYMDWNIKDVNNITDLSVKLKMSQKQPDKWITFKCEHCGNEREELINHYNKHKHHYCSIRCSSEHRKLLNKRI